MSVFAPQVGSTSLIRNETPGGTINGSNTVYTTASTFATGSLKVYLNGQRLGPGSGIDFVEATQGFTMQYAPATGDVLVVDYETTNSAYIVGTNSIIVQETPTGTVNGSTTLFTVLQAAYVSNSLEVFVNGLAQIRTTDYTETNATAGTFTFTVAPLTGDVVRVNYQFSTGASGNADLVDGFHASSTATASTLLPLNGSGLFPQSVLQTNTLGYTQITANFSTASTTQVQVTSLTTTVTIPAGGRRVKITAYCPSQANSVAGAGNLGIWDGTVGTGTQLSLSAIYMPTAATGNTLTCIAVVTPAAGSKTYNVGYSVNAGTGTISNAATQPAFILVELI